MNQDCGTAELAPAMAATATPVAGAARTAGAGSRPGVATELAGVPGLRSGALAGDALAGRSARRARLSGLPALVLLASLIVSLLAASAAPTPLYAIYQQRWGFKIGRAHV